MNPRDVGYKSIVLGDLYNSGFPVLNGFVISSKLMKEFVILSRIREKLFCFLKEGKRDKIIELILSKEVPEIQEKIYSYCNQKGYTNFFLQSSSVFKDHKYVTGCEIKELMIAVKKCWASMFCNKLFSKLNKDNLFSGVIVQNNLGIEKSGFLYTKNPLWKKKEMVVEVIKPKRYYFMMDAKLNSRHLKEYDILKCPLMVQEREMIGKLGRNLISHYKKHYKLNWVISNRAYITNVRELNKNDKDYFASQASSSELRSNS